MIVTAVSSGANDKVGAAVSVVLGDGTGTLVACSILAALSEVGKELVLVCDLQLARKTVITINRINERIVANSKGKQFVRQLLPVQYHYPWSDNCIGNCSSYLDCTLLVGRRQELFRTIRAAARGETLLQPEVMTRVLSRTGGETPVQTNVSDHETLTGKEQEVLGYVSLGDRNIEIALRLGVTEHTIKAHFTKIYNKLGVGSRAGGIVVAIMHKLISN
jgi:DNA-binding CsgD family transcriptional regulator